MPVFVAYAHDGKGKVVAPALVVALRRRGIEVIWDGDPENRATMSQPAWMMRGIQRNLVVCVLSDEFVTHFGRTEPASVRRGVRFESFLIIQKFYAHDSAAHCPIVPVADPGFAAERAPGILAGIPLSRFDAATEAGADEIAGRLRFLESRVPPAPPPRELSDIVSDLEADDVEAGGGPDLVREWLGCVAGTPVEASEFVGTLPAVEHVLRAADGGGLAQELVDRCIAVVNTTQSGLCDPSAKAKALIVGLAWLLRRRRELTLASKVVHEAVELATAAGDHVTAALGRACLGHIHRELAEDATGRSRLKHLRIAEESVRGAAALLARAGDRSGRLAACHHVLAHVHWTRYQLLGERPALRAADRLAERAARQLLAAGTDVQHELLLLRAEIAVARGELLRASALAGRVTAVLAGQPTDTTSFAGLAGRAHLVSAEVRRHDAPPTAVRHAEEALKIFDRAGLTRHADRSRWFLVALRPEASRLSRREVARLERWCREPGIRLRAVAERRRRLDQRVRPRATARGEWRDILREVGEG
ncbi:hypothetical protein M8542_48965 [Amycolatopsis sp. OK19-0408]|uniref:TIR domain-containing protein n=1 Tax=Amycolatopsis iheyensis TaxID=2945988 RepID=A0A9X2NME9_9PSEU|nr:SEFIR domain-containing protein [Amycolatopsis iheyensis]MCR6490753.1 hypothetical protein [Amycolatopsis iheyensis]